MTLAAMVAANPEMFYGQTWYEGEAFMRSPASGRLSAVSVESRGSAPPAGTLLPTAADLAELYVRAPHADLWLDYIWTADFDSQGQRVYVGGTSNGHGFEIHRHIHLADRFVTPAIRFS